MKGPKLEFEPISRDPYHSLLRTIPTYLKSLRQGFGAGGKLPRFRDSDGGQSLASAEVAAHMNTACVVIKPLMKPLLGEAPRPKGGWLPREGSPASYTCRPAYAYVYVRIYIYIYIYIFIHTSRYT